MANKNLLGISMRKLLQILSVGSQYKSLYKGMATIAAGGFLAKLVGLAITPLLTRLYTPSDFGVFAIFLSIISIFMPLLTLRYVIAIPLPRTDRAAAHIFVMSAIFLALNSILFVFIFYLSKDWIFNVLSVENLTESWWVVCVGLFIAGICDLLTYWHVRKRNYFSISKVSLLQSLSSSLSKLGLASLTNKSSGLVWGHIIGLFTSSCLFFAELWRLNRSDFKTIRFSRVILMLRRYKDIPVYRIPSHLTLIISQQIPVIFMSTMFGASVAGQFSLAVTVIVTPLALVGHSMGQALVGEAAKLGKKQPTEIYEMAKNVQIKLLFFGAIPFIMLLTYGPELFSFVFGNNWQTAGKFASIMSIYILFQFTSVPLMQLANIIEKQRALFLLNLGRLTLLISVIAISFFSSFSEFYFLILYSVANVIFFIFSSVLIMYLLYKEKLNNN
ncbi:lipopolysaccharide biosynthesis protein [Idiomarina loihiensis]|uniref:lipopolysaccharide biosynthesis protein n=1 Tax=Idiomarina loihiensis TaxID=135577 RepID=UPI00384F01DC